MQTDTSLAIETKFMKRWEFDSVTQAARCMSSWFPGTGTGTGTEHRLLKVFLESTIGIIHVLLIAMHLNFLIGFKSYLVLSRATSNFSSAPFFFTVICTCIG